MLRTIFAVTMLTATPALADFEKMEVNGTVDAAMSRLQSAVEDAGATVFARVDHAKGASDVGMELPASQLLIFGNPKLGTPVMQEDMRAGLALPLRMLIHQDAEGQVWVTYEEVEDMFDDLDVDDDSEAVEKMEGALEKFAKAAAG
ncbi:DUF302 domain-containing protein [Pseudooceanicola sp.]|uniref:DUF302 domain-containing protein n=1 Tax=Pseudooceanicola sp. TaxID=1914328 RepID=UPI0040591E36